MKKCFVILTVLTTSFMVQSSQSINYRNKTADEMLGILTGAHVRAFVVDDLFRRPLDADGLAAWNEAINHINNYVELNSKNFFGTKDKEIINRLTSLNQLNFELVKNIKKDYRFKDDQEVLAY